MEDVNKQSKNGFSFNFVKKSESKVLKLSAIGEKAESKEAPDYITALDGKIVESSKPKQTKKEYIIPLIQTNRWRGKLPEELEQDDDKTTKKETAKKRKYEEDNEHKESIDTQAVAEIIKEAHNLTEDGEASSTNNNQSIPLLMRNKVPEGFESDDRLDVSIRPDQAEVADYDEMPIEQFGLAMLRGMGWKEGRGIGKSHETDVEPMVAVARPKGLGLGADRASAQQKVPSSGHSADQDEKQEMKKGAHCYVTSGKHMECYGIVEGVDEENARVIIKLALGGSVVNITTYSVKLVSKKEYSKFSKILNKSKVDKYKEKDAKRQENCEENGYDDKGAEKRGHSRQTEKHKARDHKNKPEEHSKHRHKSKHHRHDYETTNPRDHTRTSWLQPYLRVRVIDRNFKKGKYYKEKVIIEDVVSRDECICKTTDGRVLEGVRQAMVETVIPRSDPAFVQVIAGEEKGKIGEVLQRNKERCQANIQLLEDRACVITLDYDQICEYTGNINERMDF